MCFYVKIYIYLKVRALHIIVQNNTYYSARSRWIKQQHKFEHLIKQFNGGKVNIIYNFKANE